jgi:hypothetical protein
LCEKIKNKSLSVLTTPLKPALRLLQFGILVCVLLSTYVTHTTTTTRHFFHFPPGWSANKRVGKVTRLSYPIAKLPSPSDKGGSGLAIRDGYAEVVTNLKSIKAPR